VEFALVIPLFLLIVVSIFEFSFLFTAYVSIGFATHDGSQLAAELGATAGADAAVLQRVSNDVMVPANPALIKTVDIYWVDTSTSNAAPVAGAENLWTYDGGSHAYTLPDGSTAYLPFIQSSNGYPESARCNLNSGIGCLPSHPTVDTIAVKITYQYQWITPFPRMLGTGAGGPLLTSVNVMRLEPIQ
jgi:hypothetical protein